MKLDPGNNLFVVDSFSHAIRKITPGAEVTTIAGLAGNGGSGDGSGSQARFLNPYGLAVDRNGNLRVSDTYNQTIRFLYVPIVASLTQVSGNEAVLITWPSVAGSRYQVQYQESPDGGWQNLGGLVTATGGQAGQTDGTSPPGPQRFYRVLLVP